MKKWFGKIVRGIRNTVLLAFVLSLLLVILYKYVPVHYTAAMFARNVKQLTTGKKVQIEHQWKSLKDISPNLVQAVIASEDYTFLIHNGFDSDNINLNLNPVCGKCNDFAENRSKCLSVTGKKFRQCGIGKLFHPFNRISLGQRTHSRSLSQFRKNGQRLVWRRSHGAENLPASRLGTECFPSGYDRCLLNQSERTESQRSYDLPAAPAGENHGNHGRNDGHAIIFSQLTYQIIHERPK